MIFPPPDFIECRLKPARINLREQNLFPRHPKSKTIHVYQGEFRDSVTIRWMDTLHEK
jgi:hypothetical protein